MTTEVFCGMDDKMRDRFLELYPDVFDGSGNIKNCGRARTALLIELADGLEPGVRHGDPRTGLMDVDSIRCLRLSIGGE